MGQRIRHSLTLTGSAPVKSPIGDKDKRQVTKYEIRGELVRKQGVNLILSLKGARAARLSGAVA